MPLQLNTPRERARMGELLAGRTPNGVAITGEASSLPPTLGMQFGDLMSSGFDAFSRLFPDDNPYGRAVEDFVLGSAPDSARRMAEGEPNVLFDTRGPNPLNWQVQPEALDMAGAMPFGALGQAGGALAKGGALGVAGMSAGFKPGDLAALAQRRGQADAFLSQPVEPWQPRDSSKWLFDRDLIKDAMEGHPGVTQQALPRYMPQRADTSYLEGIFEPENISLVERQIQRGRPLGGDTYYPSTYPIRAKMGELGLPSKRFDDFMWANAFTSPQSTLGVNIPTATVINHMVAKNIEMTPENFKRVAADFRERAGGQNYAVTDDRIRQMGNYLMTGAPPDGFASAQKITGYGQGLLGNLRSLPLDTHELSGLSFGSPYYESISNVNSIPKTSYGLFEGRYADLADRMGLPPTTAQASRWFGGDELTGLRSPRGDFLSTFEDLIKWNADQRGITDVKRFTDDVLRGDEMLSPYYKKGGIPAQW